MAGQLARSPLAPEHSERLPAVSGVRLATANTGTKYRGRPDLLIALLEPGSTIAGMLTRSMTCSAPVDWCAQALKKGVARAVVVNAGNANAFTGKTGVRTVEQVARAAARHFACNPDEVYLASTGVIGEPLDAKPITELLGAAAASASPDNWDDAARAIMTTDTFAKQASVSCRLDGRRVTINGIAKGSGMIAPDMATMLAFLFTDAALPAGILQSLLRASVEQSFNAITVDSDTSTSDTVLLAATGRRDQRPKGLRSAGDERLKGFARALDKLTRNLALQIVRDGEGAQKLIEVTVTGAESDMAARRIGFAIANSPLVKTAIAGEDANWGRIVMAVGKSGEAADRDRLAIRIGGIVVARKGKVDSRYREADLVGHMQGREIVIKVDVGVGTGKATVWTCDLTHGYIDINADYRS